MAKNWRDIPDTGDVVKNDQTVTLRVHYAKKKVHGKMASQCPGGCGAYLSDDDREDHHCPGPPLRLARPAPHIISKPEPLLKARKSTKREEVREFGVRPKWRKLKNSRRFRSKSKPRRAGSKSAPPLAAESKAQQLRRALGL